MSEPHMLTAYVHKLTAYISGPMTGIENYNYDAFDAAEADLTTLGYRVLNPTKNFGGDQGRTRAEYMRADIGHVLKSDVVFVLPGWQDSRGAKVEVLIAQELGIPVVDYETGMPVFTHVLTHVVGTGAIVE